MKYNDDHTAKKNYYDCVFTSHSTPICCALDFILFSKRELCGHSFITLFWQRTNRYIIKYVCYVLSYLINHHDIKSI